MGTYKEEAARREGMSYALNIAKKKGIKALEEELNFRNATNIPVKVSRKQVGRVVSIRAEKDIKVINSFTKEQKKIHDDWLLKRNRKMVGTPQYIEYWTRLQRDFKAAYSKK